MLPKLSGGDGVALLGVEEEQRLVAGNGPHARRAQGLSRVAHLTHLLRFGGRVGLGLGLGLELGLRLGLGPGPGPGPVVRVSGLGNGQE